MLDRNIWQAVDRPGYFGRHREQKHREYDACYGSGNWALGWEWGGVLLEVSEAVMLYEDAYAHFLIEQADVLRELVLACHDVYDDDPSNVGSGTDYTRQETERTHLQDIAIRRSLIRLGAWFSGRGLLRIRDSVGDHPLSLTLSPGRVPFHRPDRIVLPELAGWWQASSVESFYQSNKTLVVHLLA